MGNEGRIRLRPEPKLTPARIAMVATLVTANVIVWRTWQVSLDFLCGYLCALMFTLPFEESSHAE